VSDPLRDASHQALAALLPEETVEDVAPLGGGHIHDTRVARCRGAEGSRRFVVQRINTTVFPDPEALAANLARVSEHVARALAARGIEDTERRVLRAVAAPDGSTLVRDRDGGCWRAFPFIENTRAFDALDSPLRAHEAARAFGSFLADLSDLSTEDLQETIPAFHDLPARIAALEGAIDRDAAGRAARARAEIDTARRFAERVPGSADPEALPRRVVHNDCKLNNLLFDSASDEALCVVDLDTVMAGSAVFDFGELVRTGTSGAAEDERDLSRVRFDLALFGALAAGFVAGARGLLRADEIRAFANAGPRMALENGVRFLTDHLDGDRYFRVSRPGHNLDRARVQLRLVERMLEAEGAVRDVIDALAREAT
jgi:aminoglycoside phosphotransferase (APT) family kinase protein